MKNQPVELRPCLLCGGEVRITERSWSFECDKTTIKCMSCGLTLNHERYYCYSTRRNPATGMEELVARVPIDPTAEEFWNGERIEP